MGAVLGKADLGAGSTTMQRHSCLLEFCRRVSVIRESSIKKKK